MINKTLITIILGVFLFACNSGSPESLDPQSFENKLQTAKQAVLIDVRTPQEFAAQHLKGANNINFYDRNFAAQLDDIDHNSNVFVYCTSGNRSSKAATILKDLGFNAVYDLDGGIQQWNKLNKEVQLGKVKEKPYVYSMAEYDSLTTKNNLVLVDFMADWCGPCKVMAPFIHKLKEEYKSQLTVLKINSDFNQPLSQRFQVQYLPTIKIYHEGKLVYDEFGGKTEEQLRKALQPYL